MFSKQHRLFLSIILISLIVILILNFDTILKNPMEKYKKNFPTFIQISKTNRSSVTSDVRLIFSYGDLDKHLCEEKLDWNKRVLSRTVKKLCPQNGIVTIRRGARLGNKMWDYATVWATARRTGLKPYMPKCTKSSLDEIFEGMTIPGLKEISHCSVELNIFVATMDEWTSINQSIIFPRYTLKREVLRWPEDIVQEFRFKKRLRDKVEETFSDFTRELSSNNYTFIGVHVRRKDYIAYIKRKYGASPVNPHFFLKAMDYYKNKYSNCIFIILTDDPKWCSSQFGNMTNVHVVSTTPAQDLAIMASCNHSIFDYGTFGEWGSILAGGETIYSNVTPGVKMGTGMILKNWIMMS